MDYSNLYWRVGTGERRLIYAAVPGTDENKHPLLGIMETPQLAIDVVTAHNTTMNQSTFAEKELLIKDLEQTRVILKEHNNLEEAILLATDGGTRTKRVYAAIGNSVDILGDNKDFSKVIKHAINTIRNQ